MTERIVFKQLLPIETIINRDDYEDYEDDEWNELVEAAKKGDLTLFFDNVRDCVYDDLNFDGYEIPVEVSFE